MNFESIIWCTRTLTKYTQFNNYPSRHTINVRIFAFFHLSAYKTLPEWLIWDSNWKNFNSKLHIAQNTTSTPRSFEKISFKIYEQKNFKIVWIPQLNCGSYLKCIQTKNEKKNVAISFFFKFRLQEVLLHGIQEVDNSMNMKN